MCPSEAKKVQLEAQVISVSFVSRLLAAAGSGSRSNSWAQVLPKLGSPVPEAGVWHYGVGDWKPVLDCALTLDERQSWVLALLPVRIPPAVDVWASLGSSYKEIFERGTRARVLGKGSAGAEVHPGLRASPTPSSYGWGN